MSYDGPAVKQPTLRAGLVVGALAAVAGAVHAQWVPTTAFGVRDGLAQSQVTAITQDGHGFLWIATQGGLTRHDGGRLTTFTRREGLPDDVVTALAPSAAGGLWLGFDSGGLGSWDGASFTRHELPASGSVAAIALLADGLLVGTAGGLVHWTEAGAAIVDPRPVSQLAATSDGHTWVLADGLLSWDGERLEPPPWAPATAPTALATTPDGLWLGDGDGVVRHLAADGAEIGRATVGSEVRSLLAAPAGGVWVGASGGLWSVAGDGTVERRPLRASDPKVEVRALHLDHEGNLWIGTWSDGLHRLTPHAFTVFDRASGLAASTVWSFHEDQAGCVWMGTEDAGVLRWCHDGWREHLVSGRDLPDGRCLALAGDGHGGLYAATTDGLAHRWADGRITVSTVADGLPDGYVRALLRTTDGTLWVATRAGLAAWDGSAWRAWREADGLPDGNLRGLAADPRGGVWIATHNAGAVRFADGTFTAFGPAQGLPDPRVWCLTVDSSERLWVGTDAGIWVHPLNGGNDFVVAADGDLPSGNVLFLQEDAAGLMWAGTTRGVSLLDPEGRVLRTLTAADGLTDSEAAENAAMVDSSGRLWLGLAQGATRLDPASLPHNPSPPPLAVTALTVDGVRWPGPCPLAASSRLAPTAAVVIGPGIGELRFDFAALSFAAPDKVRYRFMLEGWDEALGPPTDDDHATYRRVPPGRYRFVLTACNNDGVWTPEGLDLAVAIRPAWYQTTLFRALLSVVLAVAPVVAFLAYRRNQRRRQELLESEVAERTSELAEAGRRIQEQNEELAALSRTDPLTGLANRRVLDEVVPLELALIERELARHPDQSAAEVRGIALMMVDLDHFKAVNDRHGHEVGDQALVAAAATLSRTIRAVDVCVRWGGEEFVILARSTDREAVLSLAHRLLEAMATLTIDVAGTKVRLSASIGFVACPLAAGDLLPAIEWRALLDVADHLMYLAKKRGRTCACGLLTTPDALPATSEREAVRHLLAEVTADLPGLELVELHP